MEFKNLYNVASYLPRRPPRRSGSVWRHDFPRPKYRFAFIFHYDRRAGRRAVAKNPVIRIILSPNAIARITPAEIENSNGGITVLRYDIIIVYFYFQCRKKHFLRRKRIIIITVNTFGEFTGCIITSGTYIKCTVVNNRSVTRRNCVLLQSSSLLLRLLRSYDLYHECIPHSDTNHNNM